MIAILLVLLAIQSEPRFTMSPEPGDRARAELFYMDGGLTDANRKELLAGAVVESEMSQDIPGYGMLRGVVAVASDGTRIGLTDAQGRAAGGNRVCRIKVRPQATSDNLARAQRWCSSFFDGGHLVVELPLSLGARN